MTRTELERLVAVEERVDSIDKRTERIEEKLDTAISCKADKSEVDELRTFLTRVLVGVAAFCAITLVGVVLFRIGLQ